jgi:hypothetical protein
MKDIKIKITKSTRYVDFENNNEKVGNVGENLQTMLVFSFTDEFVNGQARLEYTINGESQYVFMQKVGETYQTPVTSQLAQCGSVDLQLVITEGTDENEIPKFKSNVFYLPFGKSINAEIEQPEEVEEWIDIANTKLNQVDNLDIDLENNIITITRKDGTQYSENVKGDKGDKGDAGSIKFIIANELPTENIDEGAIYMKATENPDEQNTYEEYIYVNGNWEKLGNATVEINLEDYVKNTDYATTTTGGVVKLNPAYGINRNTANNNLYVNCATNAEIDAKTSVYKPITPSNLEYAVKSIGDNYYATVDQIGDIEAMLKEV